MNLSTANADFGLRLLKQLQRKSEGKGTFFSPMSLSVALGMAYAGAEGATGKEMENVLFSGLSDSAVHDSFANIVPILNPDTDAFALHCANRLYAHKDMAFKKSFLDLCSVKYQSSLAQVDFASAAEAVRVEINDWVSKTTNERIKDLISPGVLTSLTRLVLVNAIYFKGMWTKQFKAELTKEATFYASPGKETKVVMMSQKSKFAYNENEKVQVLGLPYQGDSLTMYIFLPKERYGLKDWLSTATSEELQNLTNTTPMQEVEVSLPKWRQETSFLLNDELKTLGLGLAFDQDKADFSRLADAQLFISHVIHKAYVEVSEEGTEAAAGDGGGDEDAVHAGSSHGIPSGSPVPIPHLQPRALAIPGLHGAVTTEGSQRAHYMKVELILLVVITVLFGVLLDGSLS